MALDISQFTPSQLAQVLYVGYFQRAAEAEGIDFWVNFLQNEENGPTLQARLTNAADRFADEDEAETDFPFLTQSEATQEEIDGFVTSVFQNLFNRDPEQEGLEFYRGRVEEELAKDVPKFSNIIIDILNGAQNEDLTTVENKIVAADSFTQALIDNETPFDEAAAENLVDSVTDQTEDPAQAGQDAAGSIGDPTVSVSSPEFADEGDSAEFTISLSEALQGDDIVTESTIEISKSGPAIESGETVSVDIGGETVTVTFSGNQDASGVASALADEISNLDSVTNVSADSNTITVTAASGENVEATNFTDNTSADVSATIEAAQTQGTDADVSVDYAVSFEGGASSADHGTPTLDGSNVGTSGTVTFAAGETEKVVTIPISEDQETPESGEGLTVTLSNLQGGGDANVSIGTASSTTTINDVPPEQGNEFTLTDGVDSGSAFTGTDGVDTFNATLGTFNPFDSIDGAGGNDRLNAQVNTVDYGGVVDLDGDTANIEQFYLLTTDATNAYDFANVDTATQIWTDRSTVTGINYNNIAQAVTVGVKETGTAANTSTWTYANDALGADDDATQAMAVSDAAQTVAVEVGGTDDITGLDITASGDNEIILGGTDLIDAGMTDVTVSGDGNLDLDMSANAAANHSVTFAGGDDTLRFDANDLTANDSIDLGQGEDTIALVETGDNQFDDTELGFDLSGVSNAEGLALVDDVLLGGNATLAIGDFDNVTFEDDVSSAANEDLTIETSASSLNMTFEGGAGAGVTPTDFVLDENVQNLTIENTGDATTTTLGTITNESTTDDDTLQSVTVRDSSDAGDGQFTLALGDAGTQPTAGVTSIVLEGGAESNFTVDATNADFGGPVTIELGAAGADDAGAANALTYTHDNTAVRETFVFTGDNIGDVTLGDAGTGDFDVSPAGNGDKLDFSQFSAVSGASDLSVTINGGNNQITVGAASDEFDGTMTIEVTGTTTVNDFVNDALIF